MRIGGFQKFSLLDYPDKLSAIIFTRECNFRCGFCYNPMLVVPDSSSANTKDRFLFQESGLFEFLKKRQGKLDAVVITGGEPTIHNDLSPFLKKIKQMNYLVKLDTNGSNPQVLKKIINNELVDYIAMDIKASEKKYEEITRVKVDLAKIRKSIKIIIESNLPHEFRTTIVPGVIDINDIEETGQAIKGAKLWYLQKFKSETDLINNDIKKIKNISIANIREMQRIAKKYVERCEIR